MVPRPVTALPQKTGVISHSAMPVPQGAVDLLGGELHGLEVLVHQLLAGAGGVLGDLAVKLLNAAGHVGGHGDLGALLALVLVGLAGEDVHQAGDLGAVHDGGGHGAQRGAEFLGAAGSKAL